MKAKTSSLISFIVIICSLFPVVIQAEGIGFSSKVTHLGKRIDTSLTYYGLKRFLSRKPKITLNTSNYLNEKYVFKVILNTVVTKRNGAIGYGYKEEK